MISKDVQDIIEGVHYFLSESLSSEQLTGKAECLRNALVLQLEALAVTYPTLTLHKGPSYPYLNMDQGGVGGGVGGGGGGSGSGGGSGASSAGGSGSGTVQAKRPAIANGGSGSVCSNSSNSGDPFTFPPNAASLAPTAKAVETNEDTEEEDAYEEVDQEFLKMHAQKYSKEPISNSNQSATSSRIMASASPASTSEPSNPTASPSHPGPTPDAAEVDDPDENYMTTVPNVAFSSLIVKSEKHGELLKKTKGLLRNMKKYHGVVANRLLYLYLKETDEVQKKVIDLTQYTARVATGDDFKDQRKRDAAFELVGMGIKTHTFVARTAKDKTQWLAAIERASTVKLGDTQDFTSTPKQNLNENFSLILPPKPPPPLSLKDSLEGGKESSGTKEVPEEASDELYEEMNELPPDSKPYQGFTFHNPNGASSTAALSRQPFPTFASSFTGASKPQFPAMDADSEDTYEEADPPPAVPSVTSAPGFTPKKSPPDRPQLPARLQHVVALQKIRPLPNTPMSSSALSGKASEEDGDEIYCEIDEDVNDGGYLTKTHTTVSGPPSQIPPAPPLRNFQPQPESSPFSSDTIDEEFYDELDVDKDLPSSQFRMASNANAAIPPKLPPRGIPPQQVSADDTEYKVPQSVNLDTEYQVPQSNSVQANCNSQVSKGDIPTYQVPPSNAVAVTSATQPMTEGTCNDSEGKLASDSFRTQTSVSKNAKSLEKKGPVWQKEVGSKDDDKDQNGSKSNHGYSVKDIISRMNKNNAMESGTRGNIISDKVQTSEIKDSQPKPNSVTSKQKAIEKTNLTNELHKVKPKLPEPQEDAAEDQNKVNSGGMKDTGNTKTLGSSECKNQENNGGEWYVAKFSFIPSIPESIGFDRGDPILVVDKSGNSGWWTAIIKGRTGFVPKEYVRKKE